MVNCKKLFKDKESREEFYRSWHQVLYANKKDKFEEICEAIKIQYIKYLG